MLQGPTLATEWSPMATVNFGLATVKKSRSPNWRLWNFPLFLLCNTVFCYEWWPKDYRTGKHLVWPMHGISLSVIFRYDIWLYCQFCTKNISSNLNHSFTSEVHTSGAPKWSLVTFAELVLYIINLPSLESTAVTQRYGLNCD